MQKFLHPRSVLALLAAAAICGVASSLYAQYVLLFTPCPLCIFQRVGVMGVGVFALVFAVFFPKQLGWQIFANLCISIVAVFGATIAIRQLWIQSLPPANVPVCGPGLNFMLEHMPITQVLSRVFYGSGECAAVSRLFGLPLPWWSLLFFSGVLLFLWGAWFLVGRNLR